ncbi:hypothetical protein [Chryseobacterium koreense]
MENRTPPPPLSHFLQSAILRGGFGKNTDIANPSRTLTELFPNKRKTGGSTVRKTGWSKKDKNGHFRSE